MEAPQDNEYQHLEQNSDRYSEAPKFLQTNNDITNNEKTNNENKNKTKNEEKNESGGGGLNIPEEEVIKEIRTLIAIYPKKIANFKRLKERYTALRAKGITFKQIKEAVKNYTLEMESNEIKEKYWKNLDNLLIYEELDPFMWKQVIAIGTFNGNEVKVYGEFSPARPPG